MNHVAPEITFFGLLTLLQQDGPVLMANALTPALVREVKEERYP